MVVVEAQGATGLIMLVLDLLVVQEAPEEEDKHQIVVLMGQVVYLIKQIMLVGYLMVMLVV